MFRRRKKLESIDDNQLEIPNLEQLEKWVIRLINKLELKKGEFTILPAYGGVLIYIKNQGITWIPYSEIRLIEGKIDKNKMMESGAIIGGLAIINATGGIALPFLLIPSVLKGWYRSVAKPSPKKSMTFLHSMIDEIVVECTRVNTKLLDTFENIPIKSSNSDGYDIEGENVETTNNKGELLTYTLHIKKKYFSKKRNDLPFVKFFKYLTSAFTGIEQPIFPIHPQADTKMFLDALEKNKIKVNYKEKIENVNLPKDGIII